MLRRLPARDHKKLILVDSEVAYIGGINFSDHNFAWHDLMIRIEDRSAAEWLAGVFLAGWEDREVEAGRSFGDAEIFALDGRKNEATFEPILSLLAGAQHSIDIVSPYLTFPFCGVLRSAVERGVRVRILTPQNNNRGFLWRYVSFESRRSGFQLRLFPGRMNHMKAILVDGHSLVLGSSNFDWLTYRHMGEIVAVFRQPGLIETFRERVLEPDFKASLPANGRFGQVRGLLAAAFVRLQAGLAARFCPPRAEASSKTPRLPLGTFPGIEQTSIQLHVEGRLQ
jgi:cardiolipin synthase